MTYINYGASKKINTITSSPPRLITCSCILISSSFQFSGLVEDVKRKHRPLHPFAAPWLWRWFIGDTPDLRTEFTNQITDAEMCWWLLVFFFFAGIVYFVVIEEELNVSDLLYFFTVTGTTVGFGDISPATARSRGVMICFAIFGNITLGV